MGKGNKEHAIREFFKQLAQGTLKSTGTVGTVLAGGIAATGGGPASAMLVAGSLAVGGVARILDEIIFEKLERNTALNEKKKLDRAVAKIAKKLDEHIGEYEIDLADVLVGQCVQQGIIEEVLAEVKGVAALIKEPEKAPVPASLEVAFDHIISKRNEEQTKTIVEQIKKGGQAVVQKVDYNTLLLLNVIEILEGLYPWVGVEGKEAKLKVLTAKLPVTGKELFGREKELELLDEAWEAGHTHIVSLVAWGGVGKSALVNEWLNRMEAGNWRGAEKVYGWSFYSQGTREDRQASGDEFLAHALEWFGDEDPKKGLPWEKGVRLADLVRGQRTLLVLDGLEPLQYPPGAMEGRLKDKGLGAILRELSRSNNGLCVITTREKVEDIENTVDKTTKRMWLENLNDEAGAELLRNLGVKGTKKELEDTSREFRGHALALNLLGSYLATVHDGEIRKRDLVPGLEEEEEKGGHAKRVMESYERWLEGKPGLDILYVMGLFDRPADEGAIKVLREKPAIKGLTENIVKLSEADWKFAVKHLRDLRLLAKEEESKTGRLDCHPLVREHFGAKLKDGNSDAWREAHGRLYEYFRDLPEKELPDTLEEMEPLFCAVAHGCEAGQHQDAFKEVYWRRIQREEKFFSRRVLGAFLSDLAALYGFFNPPWSQPVTGLSEHTKDLLLGEAGFYLRIFGELSKAERLLRMGLESSRAKENWDIAARDAGNLAELYLLHFPRKLWRFLANNVE